MGYGKSLYPIPRKGLRVTPKGDYPGKDKKAYVSLFPMRLKETKKVFPLIVKPLLSSHCKRNPFSVRVSPRIPKRYGVVSSKKFGVVSLMGSIPKRYGVVSSIRKKVSPYPEKSLSGFFSVEPSPVKKSLGILFSP